MIGLNPTTVRKINNYINNLQGSKLISDNLGKGYVTIQNEKREATFTLSNASEYAPISRIDIRHFKGGITSIDLYNLNDYRISELEGLKDVLAKVSKMVKSMG